MIRFFTGFFIFIIWIVFARNYYFCEIKGECGPPLTDVDSTFLKNIPHTLDLTSGDYIILENYPQFTFDYASHSCIYTAGNEEFLKLTATFLLEHKEESVWMALTGRFSEQEKESLKNSSIYIDLGLSRAQSIIDKLVNEYNIDENILTVSSEILIKGSTEEIISFNIEGYTPNIEIDNNQEDTALLEQIKTSVRDITYTDKSAKFDYNSGAFDPHSSFDVYIDSLNSYFERNPEDYLVVTGHTDSKGNDSYNNRLGLKRAESVKKYLIEHNVKVNIKTQSGGRKNLLVEDKNADGTYNQEAMSKNRRVNIKIKSLN